MDDLSFIERLALLPQFDPERRTAAHVQGQKSYAKLYASEGRTYMSSWRQGDGTHSGDEIKCPVNKPANIDIGTPVLKPRVEKPAKSADPSKAKKLKATTKTVITVESSNHNEKDQKKRTTMKSKKTADAKVEESKQKTVPPRKKRVVEESPSESSRAERLKERRERKRKKRAIVEPQTSDKENDKDESRRQTRTRNKKMPAGFALMHGFVATNVGKERLTIKPSVNIGVFSKGKASAKTKAVKIKISGKKDLHMDGYFSESKFLNKSKREVVPPDRSSTSDSKASASSRGLGEKESPKRVEDVTKTKRVPNKEVVEATSSPAKISSVVWDIELGKSLCKDDCSVPDTQKKQGSIVLNTSRHAWAEIVREGDAEKKGATVRSQDGSEAPSSIGPSQSVSQRKVKVSPAKPMPEKETRSKYFQARDSPTPKIRDKATAEPLASLCSFNESSIDIVQVPMIEDHAEDKMCVDNVLEHNGDCDRAPKFMQKEFEFNEYIPADLSLEVRDQDVHFGDKSLPYAEDDNQGDLAIFDGYQDLQIDDDFFLEPGYDEALPIDRDSEEVRMQVLDEYASFPDEFELDGCLQQGDALCDYFNDDAGQGNLEMEEFCEYSQNGNMPENDCKFDGEESVVLDHDQAFESVNGTDDDSNEELEDLQTDRFSQGRALLLGRSEQGKQRGTSSHLTSAEVDVVKRLRDHWLPQKL